MLLTGLRNIAWHYAVTVQTIYRWRSQFGFPLIEVDGKWTITTDMADLWLKAYMTAKHRRIKQMTAPYKKSSWTVAKQEARLAKRWKKVGEILPLTPAQIAALPQRERKLSTNSQRLVVDRSSESLPITSDSAQPQKR